MISWTVQLAELLSVGVIGGDWSLMFNQCIRIVYIFGMCRYFNAEGSPVTVKFSCDQSEDEPSDVGNEPGPSGTK